MSDSFWLYRWFDAMNVSTTADVRRALRREGALKELCKFASATADEVAAPVEPGYVTIAGCGLDLNVEGLFSCGRDECRRIQVDDLFKHVWHYFDRIVVDDSLGHHLRYHRKEMTKRELLKQAASFAAGVLYIREIGADHLVQFREKPYPHDWPDEARQAGLAEILQEEEELRESLAAHGKISIERQRDGSAAVMFTHPELPMPAFATIPAREARRKKNETLEHDVVTAVLNKHREYLTRDVMSAQKFKGTLAVGVDFHGRLLQTTARSPAAPDIAVHLELPVLNGVPTRELVALREHEADSFNRFRAALNAALRERIKNNESSNVKALAEEIKRDILQPELSRLERRLATAKSALAKKTAVGITAGVATAACGVMTGYLSLVPAGIMAAVGAAVTAGSRFVDDKREIANEDMYFWWKAAKIH